MLTVGENPAAKRPCKKLLMPSLEFFFVAIDREVANYFIYK
jgi:hypothetical protein